ncbi:unnamed protein product [Spirodela intermedia]|uniref:Uncharacterized protein n=1 Tax=Spirodela intermedia TaxID=51605 RepID=A0A7I8J1I9_SPIIN|nr:unnamed protein product [Spirodela intermedia]CAA6663261.1 unnamed protein product [Spirodela intermedia]
MVTAKRLLQMARKWHRIAVAGDEGSPRPNRPSSSAPSKGSFVVYSRDGGRFVVPLAYLNTFIFRELLEMSEEEFGLPSDGPIVMPCDAAVMAQAEKAIIGAIAGSRCCSSAAPPLGIDQRPLLVPGF